MQRTLTPAEVKRELAARGLSIAAWAARNGFQVSHVYAALNGRTRGLRGRSSEVAKALGLRKAPDESGRFAVLDRIGKEEE